MDTVNGIPALADTDPAALIGQYSRDLRDIFQPDRFTVPNPDTSLWDDHIVEGASILGIVLVSFRLNPSPTATDGVVIGVLPVQHRPLTTWYGAGVGNTRDQSVLFRVTASGQLSLFGSTAGFANWISGTLMFPSTSFLVEEIP